VILNTFYFGEEGAKEKPDRVGVEVDFSEGTARLGAPVEGEPYLVPGLVDIHCHGYEGLDVMEGHAGVLVSRLRDLGIEWIFPTTVTSDFADLRFALSSVVREAPPSGFGGFHLEGPYLNPARAGAQRVEAMRLPRREEFEEELGDLLSQVRLVTLAPELPGALEFLSSLRDRGIVVSAGHTDADFATLKQAYARGLKGMTHFYNAMRPFHHRELGCVGFGLTQSVYLEVIYDRVHVSREALQLVYAVGGASRVVAISDGTKLSGTAEGTRGSMWGFEVVHSQGAVRFPDGRLAGSAVTLREVFRYLWEDFEEERYLAVMACSFNARRWLGLPSPEMWLVVDEGGEIREIYEGALRFS
jgi:N-acetylglucosamine-6-phosphate deacetylase